MREKAKHVDGSVKLITDKPFNRRDFLKCSGGMALGLASYLTVPGIASAQKTKTLRFWTSQSGKPQLEAYKYIIGNFERQYPHIKVNLELFSDDDAWPRLSAAFAARDVPDLVSHLQAYMPITLDEQGLCEPFDDVIKAVGVSDFFPGMIKVYKKPDHYLAACIVNQTTSNLWYRTDLMAEAGLQTPKYWHELIETARKLTKSNIYGMALPYGKTAFASTMMVLYVRQAGGMIVAPDLSVAFNSPETVAALEFAKEIYQYCPPGCASYSFSETLNAFVSGRAAAAPYTGRAIINVNTQNPSLKDKFSVIPFPYRKEGKEAYDCSFSSLWIPKGSKNVEEAKLFAQALFDKGNYIKFLHSAPGHNLPSRKSIANSPEFRDHPLLKKYGKELDIMIDNTSKARNLVQESDQHTMNKKAGQIMTSNVLAETLQDVVIGGMPTKQAAAKGADKIAAIMKA